MDAANSFLRDRMLHGSAYPGRPLGQSLDEARRLPLRPDVLAALTEHNLPRLLG